MIFFIKLKNYLIEFIFPKRKELVFIESIDSKTLSELLPRENYKTKDGYEALFNYRSDLIKEIIWQIKYKGNRTIADKMGIILYDYLQKIKNLDCEEIKKPILLIPMPVSKKRLFERGYNQSELLTLAIKKYDIKNYFKHASNLLVKSIHTESQTKKSNKDERMKNIKGTMSLISCNEISGNTVLLIDDVLTTGATFAEAKKILKTAGAKKVICLALAH